MTYLSKKEFQVTEMWNRRGLAGLRVLLLRLVERQNFDELDDVTKLREIARLVFRTLPQDEWDSADEYIEETAALADIDLEDRDDYYGYVMEAKLNEETLRADLGDD